MKMMIDQILQAITELKPKSLFTKISSTKDTVTAYINDSFYDLKYRKLQFSQNEVIVEDRYGESTTLSILDKWNTDLLSEQIYNLLDCKLIELEFQLYTYDTWGNEEEGWDVNNVFRSSSFTEEVLVLNSTEILLSDKEIKDIINWGSYIELDWNDAGFRLSNGNYFAFGFEISDCESGEPLGKIEISDCEKNLQLLNSLR